MDFPKLHFICVFEGWLHPDDYDLLMDVEPHEWQRFWTLHEYLFERYDLYSVEPSTGACHRVDSASSLRSDWYSDEGGNWCGPEAGDPLVLYIPELGCVYEEHYDYTSLLWLPTDDDASPPLLALAERAGLYHFDREGGRKPVSGR